jgi:hypothetical protein
MAVMRVHKNANYTVMSNTHFKEKGMSLKAKGLLSLMLSLPDDWDYSIAGLATLSKDGKDSVMSALKELEAFGYLIRTRLTDERGRFAGYDYDIFEAPRAPYSEIPQTVNSEAENPRQLNTYKQSTKKQNFDKEDKSLSAVENEQPNIFTKELVKVDYIEEDNLYIADYNEFFNEMAAAYGFDVLRSCVWYFTNRIKTNGAVDEHGRPIKAKLMYCRIAIEQGAKRLTAEPKENPIAAAWGL